MFRRNQIVVLIVGTSLISCISEAAAPGESPAKLQEVKTKLLSGPLDLSGLPKGFSASGPIVSEVDSNKIKQGAIWTVTIKLVGPARLPKGAMISGNQSNLKIESQVSFTAYRDGVAAEEEYFSLAKARNPSLSISSRSAVRALKNQCAFSAMKTECISIHQQLPVIVETRTDNWIGLSMEDEELSRLRDELDTPLMEAALRKLAATVPPATETAASPSTASPPQKAGGTVWGLFSSLGKDAAKSTPADEAWQNSWDAFAREVEAMYARNATREEFIKRFNGKRVRWEGKLDNIQNSLPGSVRVHFAMPAHSVRLPDGNEYRMEQLRLTVPSVTITEEGSNLPFRATLSGGTDPAVSATTLPNENIRVITVGTAEAELIE